MLDCFYAATDVIDWQLIVDFFSSIGEVMQDFGIVPVFVAVVERGGFSAAAKSLGVSKSAVSKRIAGLERRLGVKLLQRTTRKMGLTEAGERYFAHALEALKAVQAGEDAVTHEQREPQGRLKLQVPMSFGRLHVAPLIPDFLVRYPGISVDMEMDDRVVDLVAGGFDLAIRSGTLPQTDLVVRKLSTARSVVCASPAYLARNGRPQSPADLLNHNCIAFSYSSEATAWTFFDGDLRHDVKVRGNYQVNNSEALCAALVAGSGIGRLPNFVAHSEIKKGRLLNCFPALTMPTKPIYAVFPERRFLPAKVRAFIEFAVEVFGGDPPRWDAV